MEIAIHEAASRSNPTIHRKVRDSASFAEAPLAVVPSETSLILDLATIGLSIHQAIIDRRFFAETRPRLDPACE